jgi:hypothetical protein
LEEEKLDKHLDCVGLKRKLYQLTAIDREK